MSDTMNAGQRRDPARADIRARLRRARRFLRDHYPRDPSLAELAAAAHFSRFHFHRLFVEAYGVTPKKVLTRLRIAAAKRRLRAGESPAAAANALGFATLSHFTATFRRTVGSPPARWLREDLRRDRERERDAPRSNQRSPAEVARMIPFLLQLAACWAG